MKTTEELLTEIGLVSRVTREPRLLALLEDIKEYLESSSPAHPDKAPLDAPAGRLPQCRAAMPPREVQLRKNAYMRQWMARKRQKDRDAKNAIINSTSNTDRNRDSPDRPEAEISKTQAGTPSPEDGKR